MRRVAIVGRPNVGKSALFNRLVGRREAIVADQPGVTRDVKEAAALSDEDTPYWLLDTGGLAEGGAWDARIRERIQGALLDVDVVLFCVDGRAPLTAADAEIANWLRGQGRPVLLVATKVDDPRHVERPEWYELYTLGFGEPIATAAEHAVGIHEVQAALEPYLEPDDEAEETPVTVALVGRPNAGKSSLLNALIGDERVLVAEAAGTTRDAIDVRFAFAGRPFVLVDTAGIRRKASENVEYYAKVRSEEAIRRAEVVVLVVDPFAFGDHEMRIAHLALDAGKPVVMAVNKWDLVGDEDLARIREDLDRELSHLAFAPRVYTSAETDFGLHELLAVAIRVYDTARRRVPTGELNRWLEVWTGRQAPPNFEGRPLKLLYGTQAAVAPPTFILSVNSVSYLTRAYEHYLRNRIREDLGFAEVPFRLVFKNRRGDGKRVRV